MRHLVVIWSIEFYSNLIESFSPSELDEIKKVSARKICDWAKGKNERFFLGRLISMLKETSKCMLSEADLAKEFRRDCSPFKFKLERDKYVIKKRNKIVNNEYRLTVPVEIKDNFFENGIVFVRCINRKLG